MMRLADPEVEHPEAPSRLKTRSDFLRAATGRKVHAALFTVQAVRRPDPTDAPARVGFTVTKKVGNAVERNRIKRRLREIVRVAPALGLEPSHDYVIVARRAVLDAPFTALAGGLRNVLGKVNRPATAGGSRRGRRPDSPHGDPRP